MRRPSRRVPVPAALACLCLMSATLAAQEPADTVPGAFADTIVLPEVVVTAARVPLSAAAVTSAVSVVSAAELAARGVRTVEEALRATPAAGLAGTGSFGARTSLHLRGGESDYVRVLVDGVPVNRPGGEYDLAHLTAENVHRIEVVRGPASVLYGSDAMAGVVQVFTRQGVGSPRARASVRGGTYGSLYLDADLAGGTETASYAFAIARFSTDGVHHVNNDYRNTVLSGRVQVRPDAATDATFSVRYSDNAFHFPTDGAGRLVRDAVRLEEVVTLGLDVGRFFTDRLEGRLLLTANQIGGGFDDRPMDPEAPGYFAYWSVENVGRRGLDGRGNLHVADGTVLTFGAQVEQQRERSLTESDSEWGAAVDYTDVARWTRGIYAQALTELAGALAVDAGARLERNQVFGSFATYRAGAAYRLPGETRVRAALGTGFKEPTFFENYAEGLVRGNPELVPERSRSWEVAVEQRLGVGARLGVTYFDQRFRDMIQFASQPPGSDEPNYFNIAAANSAGVEIEAAITALPAAWPLPRGTWLQANYTRLRTRVTDAGFQEGPDQAFVAGAQLLRRPTHAANLVIGARPFARGGFSLHVAHVGERDDLDFADWPQERVRLPAHTRLDLAGELTVLGGGASALPPVTLTARIENLFDSEYEEVRHYPARGRTIFLGTRLTF